MKSFLLATTLALSCAPCPAQTNSAASNQKPAVVRTPSGGATTTARVAEPCTRQRVESYFDALASRLPARAVERSREIGRSARMKNAARAQAQGGVWLSQLREQTNSSVSGGTTNYAVLGNLSGEDVEALAFIVMMEAAKSAQEDLREIMKGVKDINQEKQKVRETEQEMKKLEENESRLNEEACAYIERREKPAHTGRKP